MSKIYSKLKKIQDEKETQKANENLGINTEPVANENNSSSQSNPNVSSGVNASQGEEAKKKRMGVLFAVIITVILSAVVISLINRMSLDLKQLKSLQEKQNEEIVQLKTLVNEKQIVQEKEIEGLKSLRQNDLSQWDVDTKALKDSLTLQIKNEMIPLSQKVDAGRMIVDGMKIQYDKLNQRVKELEASTNKK